jgi:hypothetical protein
MLFNVTTTRADQSIAALVPVFHTDEKGNTKNEDQVTPAEFCALQRKDQKNLVTYLRCA